MVGGCKHKLVGWLHDVVHRCIPGAECEIAQAHLSGEAALFIDDENPCERFRIIAVAAQHGDRLLDRHVGGDAADAGGHASAGGVFLVLQQAAGEFLVARAEQAEEANLCLLTHHLENIDAVVVGEVAE